MMPRRKTPSAPRVGHEPLSHKVTASVSGREAAESGGPLHATGECSQTAGILARPPAGLKSRSEGEGRDPFEWPTYEGYPDDHVIEGFGRAWISIMHAGSRPEWANGMKFTMADRGWYVLLDTWADHRDETVSVPLETIATAAGTTKSSVVRALTRLKKLGLIEVVREGGKWGVQTQPIYRMLRPS